MAEPYAQTAVPFDQFPLATLRDPVLAGPGIGGMGEAAERYRHLADTLQRATDDLRAAMRGAQGAHDGEAAEASRQYVERLAAVGELGAGQARIAVGALDDGASYYSRVADDMRALQTTDLPAPRNIAHAEAQAQAVDELRVLAVEAAQRYESNANWSAGRTFQPFDAPALAAPGEGGGAPVTGASAGGIGTGGAGAPVVAGAGVPASTPVGGTDAGARTAGGPGVAGGPGAAGAGSAVGATPGAGGPVGGVPGVAGPGAGGQGRGTAGAGAPGSGGVGSGGVGAVPVGGGARGTGVSSPGAGAVPSGRAAAVPIGRSAPGEPGGAGTGWVPGTPWSGRPQPDAGTAARGVPAEPPIPPRPGTGPGGSAPGAAAAAAGRPGTTGMPLMPMAGAGRGQESEHTRPSWLVEDDPQAFWFSGIPEHTAGVIGGEGDTDH